MDIVFWNVDTQKDFMLPNGKLYIKGAEEINDNLQKLTDFAGANTISVVNTADYHTIKSKEIIGKPDFKEIFPPHCMAGEEGQDFIPQTYPKEFPGDYYIINPTDEHLDTWDLTCSRNIILFKDVFNVFEGNKHAEGVLKYLDPDFVVVYGVSGDYCVDYAVKGLLERQYNVLVAYDAIKSIGKTPLEEWVKLGAIIASTETILQFIKNRKEESEDFR
jgi:nicotinamidase/pyrazinamidase